jgi:hypothetical protein
MDCGDQTIEFMMQRLQTVLAWMAETRGSAASD